MCNLLERFITNPPLWKRIYKYSIALRKEDVLCKRTCLLRVYIYMYLRLETGNMRSLLLAERLSGISSHGPISQGLTWRRSEVMYRKRGTSKLRNWAYTGGWCNRSFFPVPAAWGRVGSRVRLREKVKEREIFALECIQTLPGKGGECSYFFITHLNVSE